MEPTSQYVVLAARVKAEFRVNVYVLVPEKKFGLVNVKMTVPDGRPAESLSSWNVVESGGLKVRTIWASERE